MPPIPDPLQSPAPPPSTWASLVRDPYTTACGLAAGGVVLATMDWHQPSTWVAFAVAVVWGAVQADAKRHAGQATPAKGDAPNDAPQGE